MGYPTIKQSTTGNAETLGGVAASDFAQISDGGWIPVSDTWSYASATTITVPSGAVSKYQKGMPYKLTANSVELQGYIVGIADTVLTVAGDTLTDHTFTDNYYAQAGTVPIGFNSVFLITATVSSSGGTLPTYTDTTDGTFSISGGVVKYDFKIRNDSGGTAGSGTQTLYVDVPVTSSSLLLSTNHGFGVTRNGTFADCVFRVLPNTKTAEIRPDIVTTALTLNDQNNALRWIYGSLSYDI